MLAESSGVTGVHAAVASGFGITALARRFIPANLDPVPPEADVIMQKPYALEELLATLSRLIPERAGYQPQPAV